MFATNVSSTAGQIKVGRGGAGTINGNYTKGENGSDSSLYVPAFPYTFIQLEVVVVGPDRQAQQDKMGVQEDVEGVVLSLTMGLMGILVQVFKQGLRLVSIFISYRMVMQEVMEGVEQQEQNLHMHQEEEEEQVGMGYLLVLQQEEEMVELVEITPFNLEQV